MTAVRFVIKRTANKYKIIKAGGVGRPGAKGERGTSAIPGIDISDTAIINGDVHFSIETHWGIRPAVGSTPPQPYYEDDPDDVVPEERAWPRFNPSTQRVTLTTTPGGITDDVDVTELAVEVTAHKNATTNVHGIADTSALALEVDVATAINNHNSSTANVHGIGDTWLLETLSGAQAKVDTHSADTTNVHGIADTSLLETQAGAQAKVATHNSDTTDVHGIPNTAQLATIAYVDATAAGVRPHDPAELVTTANVGLSGLSAIDGVTPSTGWRILVTGQTTAADNGIYVAASGAWTRAIDLDANAELIAGITVYIKQGSTKANTQWVLTFSGTPVIGTTAQTWTQSGGGAIPSDAAANTPSLRSPGRGATQAVEGTAPELTDMREPLDASVTAAKIAPNAEIPQNTIFNLVRDLDAKADRLNGVVTPLMEPSVGGRVTGLAIDPFDSNHFVIGGDLLGAGYSFDRGESWHRSQGLTGYEIGSMTFDKKRPGVVWAATMSGPELSLNGGIVYERKIKGLPTSGQEYFRPLEIVIPHPTDPDVYYGAAGSHRDWKTSTSDVSNFGLFYRFNVSTDTWTTLATVVADGNIHAAAVNADATCFLVGGSFGLRKSTNGTSWTDISTATGLPGSLSCSRSRPTRRIRTSSSWPRRGPRARSCLRS